jgi:hypothetical protein
MSGIAGELGAPPNTASTPRDRVPAISATDGAKRHNCGEICHIVIEM